MFFFMERDIAVLQIILARSFGTGGIGGGAKMLFSSNGLQFLFYFQVLRNVTAFTSLQMLFLQYDHFLL